MPNGKPGDHPYTDVVLHGMTVFGPRVDGLIRQIAEAGGMDKELSVLLEEHGPRWQNPHVDDEALEARLCQILKGRKTTS